MNYTTFYDVSSVSVVQREAFNNTIILLSMVKSESYYIIGFSRPLQRIEIGFDLARDGGQNIVQSLTIDFSDWTAGLTISGTIASLPAEQYNENFSGNTPAFSCDGKDIFYQRTYPTDELLPHTAAKMDRVLQASKNEILHFLGAQYAALLRQ